MQAKNFALFLIGLSCCLISYSYYLRTLAYVENQRASVKEDHEYQLVQLGEFRRDQFLIDKKTGRTWVNFCAGEAKGPDCDGDVFWEERLAVGLNGYTRENFVSYLHYLSDLKKKNKSAPQE